MRKDSEKTTIDLLVDIVYEPTEIWEQAFEQIAESQRGDENVPYPISVEASDDVRKAQRGMTNGKG